MCQQDGGSLFALYMHKEKGEVSVGGILNGIASVTSNIIPLGGGGGGGGGSNAPQNL